MICKACGVEVKEGATFCQACGARVDNKKECPKCNKLIDEDAVFCVYCGARVDGKAVCPKCGTEMEGNFCTACGTQLIEKAKKEERKPKSTISILSNCFMFIGIILTFILLFTMSISCVEKDIYGADIKNVNIFEYIGDMSNIGYNADEGEGVIQVLSVIFNYIIVIAAMVVCTVMTIISIVRFSMDVTKGEVKIGKQYAASLTFVLAVMVFISCAFWSEIYVDIYSGIAESESFSTYTQIMLRISILFALASVILRWIKEGKFLSKIILSSLILVAISVFVFSTMGNAMKTTINGSGETIDSPVWFYSTVSYIYATLAKTSYAKTYTIGVIHAFNYICSIAVAVSFIVCVASNLSSVFAKKKEISGNIVANSIFLGFSALWLITSISAINDLKGLMQKHSPYMYANYSFSPTGPILAVVLGAVLLGISITGSILLKKKKI